MYIPAAARHAAATPAEGTGMADTLADENAIRRLTAFYCDAVAHQDPDRAASVYAEDGTLGVHGTEERIVGRKAIADTFRHTFATFSFMQQVAHAGLVDVAGGRATARWSIIEINRRLNEDALSVLFGAYEDELTKLDAGWRFSKRTIRVRTRTLIPISKFKLMPLVPFGLELAI
jgi:hypothetical protein